MFPFNLAMQDTRRYAKYGRSKHFIYKSIYDVTNDIVKYKRPIIHEIIVAAY